MVDRVGRLLAASVVLVAAVAAFPQAALAADGPGFRAIDVPGQVPIQGQSTFGDVGVLSLPTGLWVISAKLDVAATGPTTRTATCRLAAGADLDAAQVSINTTVGGQRRASLLLLVSHQFSSAGQARLRCAADGNDGSAIAQFVRIQAMHAGKVQRIDLRDGTSETLGTGSPTVIDARLDGPFTSNSSSDQVATLQLGAGSWSIVAKVVGQVLSQSYLECRLEGGGIFDDQYALLPANAIETEALALVPTFAPAAPSQVAMRCVRNAGVAVRLKSIHFLALKAGTLMQPSQATVGTGKPVVVAGHYDDQLLSGGGGVTTFATLHLDQGDWAVVAKLEAFVASGVDAMVVCQLSAGTEIDESRVKMGNVADYASMSFSLTRTFTAAGGGNVILRCSDSGPARNQSHLAWVKIIAVRAGSLS